MKIAIIGAGIVGSAIGCRLTQAGHCVTFFDPNPDGRPASYGNAGHVGTASILPWASVDNLRLAWASHRDPNHPLVLHLRDLVGHPRWLVRFLAACRPERYRQGVCALASILTGADDWLRRMIDQSGCGESYQKKGLLHVYLSEAARLGAEAGLKLRQVHGIPVRRISPDELFEMEPHLLAPDGRSQVVGATLFPSVAQVISPYQLVNGFRAAAGFNIVETAVTGLQAEGDRVQLLTSDVAHVFDGAVIAAGAASERLAAPLGARVPVIRERGYHRQFSHAAEIDRSALLVDMRVVASPTPVGVRLTTGAEFCNAARPPDHARMAPVFARAEKLLGLQGLPADPWSGDRPSTPDSLPVIGSAPKNPRVFLAYGHGHLGLTLSGITAESARAHFDANTAPLDLSPFDPAR